MNIPLSPPPLKKGDTLGVVAPAGMISDTKRFINGISRLREMGFRVIYPAGLWPGKEYLADSDENRGAEFNHLISNPEIDALISLRGGYGCLRMIDRIDLNLVATHPKLIIGFSDISVLQNYLYTKTGLISLHGPVVNSLGESDSSTLDRLFLCLVGRWDEPLVVKKIEILRNGPALISPLVGGNLSSLSSLLGTSYDFSWDDKIVFLEDINEPAYRVDRMLTQLSLAGKFKHLSGLILGDFSGIYPEDAARQRGYIEAIWNRVLELCAASEFPIWGNFPFGHCRQNLPLPVGALCQMQSEKTRLLFSPTHTRYVI